MPRSVRYLTTWLRLDASDAELVTLNVRGRNYVSDDILESRIK